MHQSSTDYKQKLSENKNGWTFSLKEALIRMMDWSRVDYSDVFISCLDSHSDGTHSLQSILW